MLVGTLASVARVIPERRVNEVDSVIREPARDLHGLVDVDAFRVAEVFRRQTHTDDERCRDLLAYALCDRAHESSAAFERAAPTVGPRILRRRQELREQIAM